MNNLLTTIILCLTLFSGVAFSAQWQIEPKLSQVNFISIKKNHIAELHTFRLIDGYVDGQGSFVLNIDLASVDTAIPIRDSRMKQHLFEINTFAKAIVSAKVDNKLIAAMIEDTSKQLTVDAVLTLHDHSKALKIDVIINRLAGGKLAIASAKPVLINATDFGLNAGVDKLMELAKLPSISYAVPVTFYLTLALTTDQSVTND